MKDFFLYFCLFIILCTIHVSTNEVQLSPDPPSPAFPHFPVEWSCCLIYKDNETDMCNLLLPIMSHTVFLTYILY